MQKIPFHPKTRQKSDHVIFCVSTHALGTYIIKQGKIVWYGYHMGSTVTQLGNRAKKSLIHLPETDGLHRVGNEATRTVVNVFDEHIDRKHLFEVMAAIDSGENYVFD